MLSTSMRRVLAKREVSDFNWCKTIISIESKITIWISLLHSTSYNYFLFKAFFCKESDPFIAWLLYIDFSMVFWSGSRDSARLGDWPPIFAAFFILTSLEFPFCVSFSLAFLRSVYPYYYWQIYGVKSYFSIFS